MAEQCIVCKGLRVKTEDECSIRILLKKECRKVYIDWWNWQIRCWSPKVSANYNGLMTLIHALEQFLFPREDRLIHNFKPYFKQKNKLHIHIGCNIFSPFITIIVVNYQYMHEYFEQVFSFNYIDTQNN